MARRPTNKPPAPEAPLVSVFNGIRDELISTITYMLGSRDEAQDVAQEAFLKCWRARDSMPDVQNLRAWIFRVAMNAARDHQRSGWHKRSRPMIAEESIVTSRETSITERMAEAEQIQALRQALLDLREEEREVFLLRQNGELTYEQIAELRAAPVGTIKTQMRSALIKLRKVLNPGAADATPTDE